jgi:hypothetical protein
MQTGLQAWLFRRFAKKCINDYSQWRQVANDGLPDPPKIHPQVIVNKHVSHPCDLTPGDLGIGASQIIAEIFSCLSKHL